MLSDRFALLDNMYERLPLQIRLHSQDPAKATRNLSIELIATFPALTLPLLLYKRISSLPRAAITAPIADMEGCSSGFSVQLGAFKAALEDAALALEKTLIGCFATRLDEDVAALEDTHDHRSRFALIHRITRKNMLRGQISFFRALSTRLGEERAAKRTAESLMDICAAVLDTYIEWYSSIGGDGGRCLAGRDVGLAEQRGESELKQGLLELVSLQRKTGEKPLSVSSVPRRQDMRGHGFVFLPTFASCD